MDNAIIEQCKKLRIKNHKTVVLRAEYGDFENEALLKVTHNGYQWSGITLSKVEALDVIVKLSNHFNLPCSLLPDLKQTEI